MRSRIRVFAGCVFTACVLVACGESPAPTAPSSISSASALAISRSVDWSLFAGSRSVAAAETTGAAADVPTAPANLAFTVSGSTVILAWSAPGSGNATSYVVEAGTGAGLNNIASFNTGNSATTLTVIGVPNGTYFVRVRAHNADGNSGPSNEITIVISSGPCGAPAAPTGLTPGGTGNTVALSWTAAAGATSYVVEAGTAPGAANLASFDTGSPATSFSATAPNGTYYIRVRARTSCGTSGPSNEVVIVVGSTPSPPSPVTGRWRGVSPEGMIADPGSPECPVEWDLEMDLTVSGTTVSGTATTRNRRVQFARCSDVFGAVATYDVTGTAEASGAIALRFGVANPAFTLNGTFTATRMTGRFVAPNNQPGGFAVTRQ